MRRVTSISEIQPNVHYHIIVKENKSYNLSPGSNASNQAYISGHIDNLVADFNPTTSSLSGEFIGVAWGHGIMAGYNVYNINNDTHGKLECDFRFDSNSNIHNINSITEDFLSLFYILDESELEDIEYTKLTNMYTQFKRGQKYHIIIEANKAYTYYGYLEGEFSNIQTEISPIYLLIQLSRK